MKIYLSIFNISAPRLVKKTLEVKSKEKRKKMDDVPMILSPQMKMELWIIIVLFEIKYS